MNTQAVIFDVDGTLLDTRDFITDAFKHALAAQGHPTHDLRERLAAVGGMPLEDCYVALAPDGDIVALIDSHREFQYRGFDLILAYDGLNELLDTLRGRGVLVGACSSRGKNLKPSLEHLSVLHHFDMVVDATDVSKHKPHPEGLLKILHTFEIEPAHAAMIGDSPQDILAGKAANVGMTIAITHGFGTRETLSAARPDHIVDSLHEVLPLLG